MATQTLRGRPRSVKDPPGYKRCSKCAEVKLLGEFSPRQRGSNDGKTSSCKECCRRFWHERHSSRYGVTQKRYHQARKESVINGYGGKCACCGETLQKFLTIDHKNNDGAAHRKQLGSGGAAIYRWIIKNNFPSGFQILCFNCNIAKGLYGVCPHEEGRSARH